MEHVFNQFTAFLRSWRCLGANETPVAGDTRESMQISQGAGRGREHPTLATAEGRWLSQDD